MQRIFSLFRQNVVNAGIFLIMTMIVLTVIFAFRNQFIMRQTNAQIAEANTIIRNVNDLWTGINLMDLGVRGYALTKKDGLLSPFEQALKVNPTYLDTIRIFMNKQNLSTDKLNEYIILNNDYIQLCKQMIALAQLDSMRDFTSLLEEDRGLALWQAYSGFSSNLVVLQNNIKTVAEDRYHSAVNGNIMLQVFLFLVGVPSLYFIYYRIRKHEASIKSLQLDLEHNNRRYVFDPGTEEATDLKATMTTSIDNLKKASIFIDKITKGEFDAVWPGMNQENKAKNKDNLSGTLIHMRDQMRRSKEEDKNRIWVTEGLTKFTEIIRQHQENVGNLCEQAVRFLAKYLEAQQGGVFLLQEEDGDKYLELVACFAFDKKKFVEKRVHIGEGLIGQAFMEGDTVVLREVPKGYTHITSGLGEATPNHILIVPMKYNEHMEGIMELAGFHEWQDHERNFMDKATEYMAAALSSVRSTQKMKIVLEQMQTQTEQLHAQEEEMRQNMEELAATNEEMKRKEAEYLKQIGSVATTR